MSRFKLSIDEDILLIRTSPSLVNMLIPLRHWSYAIELPVKKILGAEVVRRAGVLTLIITKQTGGGPVKNIVVSLARANKHEVEFLRHALPKIIEERPPMHEIKKLINKYLKKKERNLLGS